MSAIPETPAHDRWINIADLQAAFVQDMQGIRTAIRNHIVQMTDAQVAQVFRPGAGFGEIRESLISELVEQGKLTPLPILGKWTDALRGGDTPGQSSSRGR